MQKEKIGIIGHFGGKEKMFDGQTIKTKNAKNIIEKYGDFETFCVDTYLVKKHKIRLLLDTFKCLFKCKKIVILLSTNGLNFYLPFLYYVNKLFKRKIYHDIIGSELIEMVESNPKLVKYLNKLEVNWFEFSSGVEFFKEKGIKNVELLPNCKELVPIEISQVSDYDSSDKVYRFCTFSRIIKEKGITDAILAIADFNKKNSACVATLDVYGKVDDSYKEEFEKLLKDCNKFIFYRGAIESEKSVDTLKNYYVLLFPTYWRGEGFPGTILDAYASALPVIASDWRANKEIIKHKETGYVYPCLEFNDLQQAIEFAIFNEMAINKMRKSCRLEYENYTPEKIGRTICDTLKK